MQSALEYSSSGIIRAEESATREQLDPNRGPVVADRGVHRATAGISFDPPQGLILLSLCTLFVMSFGRMTRVALTDGVACNRRRDLVFALARKNQNRKTPGHPCGIGPE